ncbi:MAG: type II toxin-antitoxin system prevent-host-death family antitoxin [Gemmatimonadota bacterium]|nr:type II toxin-antitoxin system prevent-host-death family antitoxin [Gemmatimonadota bacterium]
MKRVSISDLKAKLSQYVDLVQSGEDIIVTDRGRPVARLVGLAGETARESRLHQLIRLGRVRPPVGRRKTTSRPPARPADPEGRALDALLDERRTGR